MPVGDQNLGCPEVYVPLEGGLWTCPACEATNLRLQRICKQCGQLVRHRKTPARLYSAAFFFAAAIVVYCVSSLHHYVRPSSDWIGPLAPLFPRHTLLGAVFGGFNWLVLALVAAGVFFLWRRPTGAQYARQLHEQGF